MRLRHFGDSYDVVKQSLLRWLSALGPWAVQPMFTEAVDEASAGAFGRFLNARLLSTEQVTVRSDRASYFASAAACSSHLFLDPDTGLRLKTVGGKKAPAYVFGAELQAIASARPERLSLVFDQSLSRNGQHAALVEKLQALHALGLSSLAFESHACFVLVATKDGAIDEARSVLLRESRLPESRILRGPQSNQERTSAAQAMNARR